MQPWKWHTRKASTKREAHSGGPFGRLYRSRRRRSALRAVDAGHHELQVEGFFPDSLIVVDQRKCNREQRADQALAKEGAHGKCDLSPNRQNCHRMPAASEYAERRK